MLSSRLAPTLSLANGFPQDDTNVASAMPVLSSSRRARPGLSKFAHSSYPPLRSSSLQSLSFVHFTAGMIYYHWFPFGRVVLYLSYHLFIGAMPLFSV